MADMCAA